MNPIEAYTCKQCGKTFYPRHARCPGCKAEDFNAVILEGTAKLLTFTRAHQLSLAFTERYITLGIVEFENGARALGRLLVDDPRVGMKLRAELGTVSRYGYQTREGLTFIEQE
jgi:uncharacterized OB-fold protein